MISASPEHGAGEHPMPSCPYGLPGLLGRSCRRYLNLPAWGYLRSIYCVLKRMIYHYPVFSVRLVSAIQTGVKVGCLLALGADHTMPTSPGHFTEMPCIEHKLWSLSQGHFFLILSLFYHIVFSFMVISFFFPALGWKSYYHSRAAGKYLA